MDDALKLQLNNLQLSKVTSTDKVIGRGAYGRAIEVYVHGTLCAAKEIHPALIENVSAQESETIRRSFCEECVKASRIHHPNIVQMLGIYYPTPQAKLPWLVMELMQTSLKGFLEKYEQGKVPLHFKLSMLVDVAQGLEFLHGQDIIHRDLSSNNVLLTKNLTAKIADLGVAKIVQENKIKTHTQAPGTIHFMPPEALKSKPHYGKPVDVFSLACVALQVMSHQWPEPKDRVSEDTMIALTEIQRRDEYITFCTQPALKELVELCLHNKPEQRPEISAVCVKLKKLKVTIVKQIPFATDSNFELFDVVRQANVQNQKLTTANKKLTTQLEEKGQQIREKDNQLCDKDQQIQKRDDQLHKKDQQIRETVNQLQEKDQKRDNQLRDRDQEIRKRDDQLREKDQQIQKRDDQLRDKDQQIQERDNQLHDKDQEIRERDDHLRENDQQIRERADQLREKDQQIRERDDQLREKDQQIRERDDQLRENEDQQIRERADQLREKDQQIDQKMMELQLVNICSSTSKHHKEMVDPSTIPPPDSRENMPEVLPASKYGKTNLNFLKNYKKEVTQTVVQTGDAGPHLQATGNYANADDPPKGGGLCSLPSVTVSSSGSSPHVYKRQASIPNDTSLSGGSERMAGISTDATTSSNQLAVSGGDAVLIVAVPITDRPTPEASQAPPDSKYGKTNLNALKNRLQHKKEVTQTVVQTGGPDPHLQATINYANAEIPYQGVPDSTNKPVAGKTDLTSLRNRLEKSKEVREKKLTAGNVNKNADEDYSFLDYIPVMIDNPPNKRPMAVPRTVNPSNHASNDTRSALSASSSKRTYQLWQCAHCQTINEARHTACEHCKLPLGKMADRSYFCNFCQMMIFIPVIRVDLKETCCPRCKHIYDSVL